MKERIQADITNLSSRKLWNIVQISNNNASTDYFQAVLDAAEKELIARKVLNRQISYIKPH